MKVKTIFHLALGALVTAAAVNSAQADELPMLKAGLWEQKSSRPMPGAPKSNVRVEINTRVCVDQTIAKNHRNKVLTNDEDTCPKQVVKKTATGYAIDSVCTDAAIGLTETRHTEIIGDFNSGYTSKSTSHSEGKNNWRQDESETDSFKYLGDCPAGWKPGEVKMLN